MRIVLLGPPGSGRRVLAKKLASHFGLQYFNLGELLGRMAEEETELGRLVGELLSACAPIPEELAAAALNNALSDLGDRDGFILDDYPREIAHADILDGVVDGRGTPIDVVISLAVDADELMERLVGRSHCDTCGADYNIYTNPPLVEGVCDACGSRIARRPTDYEETIANRLRIYEGHVSQLNDRYRGLGILHEVRGSGDDPRVLAQCVKIIAEAPEREVPSGQDLAKAQAERSAKKAQAKKAPAKKAPAKKAQAKKAQAKKTPAKKTPAKKTPAKKTLAKKAPAKKTPAKKAPAKKAPAKKAPAKKAPAKKAPPKKAPAKKTSAKKTPAKKAPAKKTSAKKTSAKKTSAKKAPAKKAPAKKAPAKKTSVKKAPAKKTSVKKTSVKKAPAKKMSKRSR